MIGILLNDSAYEQDIRELLMAFYPGQTFAHEMQEDLDFFVEGTVNEDRTEFTLCLGYFGSSCFHLLSMEKLEPEIRAEFQAAAENSVLKVNYENRFETKNKIKRRLYVLLMQQTGKPVSYTHLSFAMARNILRRFSACISTLSLDQDSWVSFVTPSTRSATSGPNSLERSSSVMTVSSTTS